MDRRLSSLAAALFLAACATPAPEAPPAPPPVPAAAPAPAPAPAEPPSPPRAAQLLAQGLKSYDNGQYKVARQQLKAALDEGLGKADQVAANKTLAFIACAGGQRTACKAHFRQALALDPGFELSRTEAGHPVWGKAFREVKAEPRK